MRTSKALRLLLLVLEAGGIGLMLICGQTMFSLFESTTPSNGQIPVSVDKETNVATLTYASTSHNGGVIATRLVLVFGISIYDGSYSARNETAVYLEPGSSSKIALTIKVPYHRLEQYTDGKGTLNVYISISALNDLVMMSYDSKSRGSG